MNMDRRVKERLVGATILGALLVLLVPELLSGPKPAVAPATNPTQPVRNVTVDLPAAAPAPVDEPRAPGPASSAQAPPSAPAEATPPRTEAPASALESPSSPPISASSDAARRGWSLQLGSFASRENADKIVRQLKARGFPVYVVSSGSGTSVRHKVRIGPIADRAAAERLAAKLKAQKFSPAIVPPG
jgi:DedD protein